MIPLELLGRLGCIDRCLIQVVVIIVCGTETAVIDTAICRIVLAEILVEVRTLCVILQLGFLYLCLALTVREVLLKLRLRERIGQIHEACRLITCIGIGFGRQRRIHGWQIHRRLGVGHGDLVFLGR